MGKLHKRFFKACSKTRKDASSKEKAIEVVGILCLEVMAPISFDRCCQIVKDKRCRHSLHCLSWYQAIKAISEIDNSTIKTNGSSRAKSEHKPDCQTCNENGFSCDLQTCHIVNDEEWRQRNKTIFRRSQYSCDRHQGSALIGESRNCKYCNFFKKYYYLKYKRK